MCRLFLVLFFSITALGQEPITVHFTEKEGLPDNEFYSVLEDDNGFIWLGADKGLFRYDGRDYKLFSHPKQVGLSAFSITKDDDNIIWYTNLANQLFYIKDEKVVLFGDFNDIFSGNLYHIFTNKNKIVLTTTIHTLILDKLTKKVLYKKEKSPGTFYGYPFLEENSILFFGPNGNLTEIDSTYNFIFFENKSSVKFPKDVSKRGHVFKIDDKLIFNRFSNVNSSHLYKIVKKDNHYVYEELIHFTAAPINGLKKNRNSVFIATTNGLYQYKFRLNKLVLNKILLTGKSTTDVLEDKNGNLWITTLNDGVYIIPNLGLTKHLNTKNYAKFDKVFSGKENEIFLVGDKDSLKLFNIETNKVRGLPIKDADNIEYLFYDKLDKTYYLDNRGRVNVFDFKNKTTLKKIGTYKLLKDHFFINKDSIMLATNGNIFIDQKKDIFKKKERELFKVKVRGYSCFYDKKRKKYFFGSVQGLFFLNKSFEKKEITFNGNSIYIKEFVSVNDNEIWALSFKNGIYKIIDNKVVQNITQKDGLLSNINSQIVGDKHNNTIWIAGEKGIQRFSIATNTFDNLTKINGIPSYNIKFLKIFKDRLYIVSSNEVFSLDTKTIFNRKNKTIPKPYFTNFYVNNNLVRDIKKDLKVNEGENVKIEYNVNGFLSKENTLYQYRLVDVNNINRKWDNDFTDANEVLYNKISQGDYTFQLRAKRENELSEIISLPLRVKGFFYNQWWFYLISTLVISGFLLYYFSNKNKRLKEKQSLELEKQNKEIENIFLKLENLRSQMNPHFVFNALNSIQDYILNNQKHLAGDYLGKFADLIRKYLDQSSQKEILLQEEIDTLLSYLELEKLRFEDNLNYEISVSEFINTETIKIPTILIQPYIENALKHGLLHKNKPGHLKLAFDLSSNKKNLIIIIVDDGVGRTKASEIQNLRKKKHKSFATKATKARLDLLNYNRDKKIDIETTDAFPNKNFVGTKVMITIPL